MANLRERPAPSTARKALLFDNGVCGLSAFRLLPILFRGPFPRYVAAIAMTILELHLDDPSFDELARLAAAAHQPVDAFAEKALREAVAAYRDREYLAARAACADDAAFAAVLAKIPNVEPEPHDRW